MPVCCFSRSKFEYPEYHTHKDNFNVVTQKGLEGSFKVMKKIIDAIELELYPKTTVLGEPNLGKRGLYSTLSQKGKNDTKRLRLNLIAQSDGMTNIIKITKLLKEPLDKLCNECSLLKLKKVLK
mgnify:CR=1 FL=1